MVGSRHGGDHDCHPPRAGIHEAREDPSKFEGCYHGHADSLLVKAGSGVATLSIPEAPASPGLARLTVTVPVQRSRRREARVKAREGHGLHHRRTGNGQHGARFARTRFLEELEETGHEKRDRAHFRRGHHGIPAALRRFPTSRWRAARYDLVSGRSSVGTPCPGPSGRKGGSWKRWRRRAPSTRRGDPVRHPWPWPPGLATPAILRDDCDCRALRAKDPVAVQRHAKPVK